MRKKSKKQSATLPLLELLDSQRVLFLDRDQGNKIMPEILTKAGVKCHCHSEFYPAETNDDLWIREVAAKGWLIISSDKGLETDAINKLAVIESKAQVYILDENNARAVYWAAAVLVSKERIHELARDHAGPFYVNLHRKTATLVWKFREPKLENSEPRKTKTEAIKDETPSRPTSSERHQA